MQGTKAKTLNRKASSRVVALAWPLILSNVTVPLLGLVDTAVMGHLPDSDYLGAVTLGATLFSFLYWGFGFLRMGTTGFVAQAHGRNDADALRELLAQGLVIAAAIGAALIALAPWVVPAALSLFDASPAVTGLANTYATWRIASAPAVLANYVLIGWFLGLARTRVTLVLMLVNNVINIVLDLWLVVGLGWTVAGVALASVIADYLALATALALAAAHLRRLGGRLLPARLAEPTRYLRLLRVNAALFVRTLCLLFAIAFFHAQGARFGDDILAANAVLMQFLMLTSYALDGFAHAAEALVGEALGRDSRRRLAAVVRAATLWSLVSAVLASVAFAMAGEAIIALLTDLPRVRAIAADYLPWLIALPLVAVWSYLLDGLFIGATRARAMRDTMLVAVIAVYLPAWWLTRGWGNHGLWFAFLLFTLARSGGLGLVFRRADYGAGWLPADPLTPGGRGG
ncbi:MATE family efflux transporter [Arhodomonas aquaeolei]|uniref:MATE family efflux transporter n=1 Tax=Arhodomonas aquaeolei TaxID=2369 RepID=UPI0003A7B286|nr:MATE family efflux transporter [Arhodomonas aquaeolei]